MMKRHSLDHADYEIIRELQENSRASMQKIATSLGYSKGKVYKRLNRLLKNGIVTMRAIVDPYTVGYDMDALIMLRVKPGFMDRATNALVELDPVIWLGECSGAYDTVVRVVFRDKYELAEFVKNEIAKVPGVMSSETMVLFTVRKWPGVWIPKPTI